MYFSKPLPSQATFDDLTRHILHPPQQGRYCPLRFSQSFLSSLSLPSRLILSISVKKKQTKLLMTTTI